LMTDTRTLCLICPHLLMVFFALTEFIFMRPRLPIKNKSSAGENSASSFVPCHRQWS
jgi:hypothetical protein